MNANGQPLDHPVATPGGVRPKAPAGDVAPLGAQAAQAGAAPQPQLVVLAELAALQRRLQRRLSFDTGEGELRG